MSSLHQPEMGPAFGFREAALPEERVLSPDEQVQVDLTTPLADSHEVYSKLGIIGNQVATVDAGGMKFGIVDIRDTASNRDFFITGETLSLERRVGFKGLKEGEPVVIGREHYPARFDYPDTVSRDHFEVTYKDDGLFIRNLRPTNKTIVTAHLIAEQDWTPPGLRLVEAVRTCLAEERVLQYPSAGEKDGTAPYGYYLNLPILGRASDSVEGGVYMGGSAREAIVVDGRSTVMQQVYRTVELWVRQSSASSETLPAHAVLLEVMQCVQRFMPYDGLKAADISRQYYGDKLVGLSTYLKERAGVCRHQALLAAYIIENLIKNGHISGAVGVERNAIEEWGGTHAWAVYKTHNNDRDEVIVVDPAHSFVGTKDQARREGRWEYHLASDEY